MTDFLTFDGIKKHLKNPEKFNISIFDSIDSTNIYLKKLAREDALEGRVIIADSQTNGHGRFDRTFHSPKNCGIYMSILLKPSLKPEEGILITSAAAVAVCLAVEKLTNHKTGIKWVNDVLVDNKKICGILTEGSIKNSEAFDWAVLGIGINAYPPENGFAHEIKDIATWVFQNHIQGMRDRLCGEILNIFFEIYQNIEGKTFLEEYRSRSVAGGKNISVLKNGTAIPAKAIDIDNNCRLLVEYEDGRQEMLNSGEISIKL